MKSPLALLALLAAFAAAPAAAGPTTWTPTWYAAPALSSNPKAVVENLTIREIVHTTRGGQAVRITLSNAYGETPLHIDHAYLAERDAGADAKGPGVKLSFQGAEAVTIPAGGSITSDAADFPVRPQADLAVSLYVAKAVAATAHLQQRSAIYFAKGDVAASPVIPQSEGPAGTWASNLFLTKVEVAGAADPGLVAAFGDSITDGLGVHEDAGLTWPDRLYARLEAEHLPLAVINAGLSGNRLTRPPQWAPFGDAGLSRFDRDVLSQAQLSHVVVLIGINDIGQSASGAWDAASAEEIEAGLTQLIARAHARKVKIFLGTLIPFRGAKDGYYTDEKEKVRQAVNAWIRQNRAADGVADFDRALDDPAHPGQMRPAFDSGDHLHPNAQGAAALAAATPLTWFH